jgi:hypothetical protein
MAINTGPKIIRSGLTLHLDAGLTASYPGSGNIWYDVSGNSNHGTLTGSPSFTTSNNGIFTFNGTSQFVDLTSKSIAASGNTARTMLTWINNSNAGAQRCIISTGTAANGQSFNLVTYGSAKVGVMGYNLDFYPTTGANVTDGNWHFVGAVANGSSITTTYVDGNLDNTSGTLTYSTTGQNNYIGKSSHVGSEAYWNGSIAVVYIYNRALSLTEIRQIFETTKRRFNIN